ncbi:MAG: HAD family hydrolase [Planctomycetota bacterium]
MSTPRGPLEGVRLALLDIDGTLVLGESLELANVATQLARLRQLGVQFSIATGRTIAGAGPVVRALGVQAVRGCLIAYNGAVTGNVDGTPWIHRSTICPGDARAVAHEALALGLSPLIYCCRQHLDIHDAEYVLAQQGTWRSGDREFNGMAVSVVPSLADHDLGDAISMLISCRPSQGDQRRLVDNLRSRVSGATCIECAGAYVEVRGARTNKLEAARAVASHLALELGQVMAIGDNTNDLALVGGVGFGVAVSNSPTELKSVASYTCQRPGPAGVVEALRMLADTIRARRRVTDVREA